MHPDISTQSITEMQPTEEHLFGMENLQAETNSSGTLFVKENSHFTFNLTIYFIHILNNFKETFFLVLKIY